MSELVCEVPSIAGGNMSVFGDNLAPAGVVKMFDSQTQDFFLLYDLRLRVDINTATYFWMALISCKNQYGVWTGRWVRVPQKNIKLAGCDWGEFPS